MDVVIEDLATQINQITLEIPDADQVKALVKELNLTQSEAAAKIGIDPSTFSRWLSGDLQKIKKTGKNKGDATDTTFKISVWWKASQAESKGKKKSPKEKRETDGYVYVAHAITNNPTSKKESNAITIQWKKKGFKNISLDFVNGSPTIHVLAILYFKDAENACQTLQKKYGKKLIPDAQNGPWFDVPPAKIIESLFDLFESM